jgi:hypothetical protein
MSRFTLDLIGRTPLERMDRPEPRERLWPNPERLHDLTWGRMETRRGKLRPGSRVLLVKYQWKH